MTIRTIRKLVTIPWQTWEAVERFRVGRAVPRCASCGQPFRQGKPPGTSDTLRELVESGLQLHEKRKASAAGQSEGADHEKGVVAVSPLRAAAFGGLLPPAADAESGRAEPRAPGAHGRG